MRDSKEHWNSDWRTLAVALLVSCIAILVRVTSIDLVAFNKYFCRFVLATVLRRSLRAFMAVSPQARQPSTWVMRFPFSWPSSYTFHSGPEGSFQTSQRRPPMPTDCKVVYSYPFLARIRCKRHHRHSLTGLIFNIYSTLQVIRSPDIVHLGVVLVRVHKTHFLGVCKHGSRRDEVKQHRRLPEVFL